MKETEKKKPVKTIPKGVWESSRPEDKKEKFTNTSDLQGNGYPGELPPKLKTSLLPSQYE